MTISVPTTRVRYFYILLVILLLAILRVPYLYTHHVQEDAYIHFRHMQSLAETGEFGFNPDERVNGSSSTFYTLFYTPLFVLFGKNAVTPILVLNTIILTIAILLLVHTFMPQRPLWQILMSTFFISLFPVSLVTSYSGMETGILIFVYCLLAFDLAKRGTTIGGTIGLILLPWIRLDSVVFAGLYLLMLFFQNRQKAIRRGIYYVLSLSILLSFNYIYFGNILPETIAGKNETYGVSDKNLATRIDGVYRSMKTILLPTIPSPKMRKDRAFALE